MDTVRTVSDTKREFYTYHTRPINSVYRRVIEELLVEMHLLSVSSDFRYDPIYALGVVNSFERFLQGYKPEADKESIFNALCKSVGGDPQQYRHDAETILGLAKDIEITNLVSQISPSSESSTDNRLIQDLRAIANRDNFKYSRLFAIGLYTILVDIDPELITEQEKRKDIFNKLSEILHLPPDKLQKDLDLYRGNLDKMAQLLEVIEEALQADRKKREQEETKPENSAE